MARNRQVREDDGTLSPYRERKVAEAIHQALRESGSDDRGLAEELAGVVTLFLERTHPETAEPPRLSEVAETIERVLRETGNEPAARRFDKLRRLRAQLRDELCVRSRPFRGTDDVLLPGEMGGDVETSRWSRTRLVRSLSEGAELPAPVAEEIAAAVEQKIFGLKLRSVSADLIRHLIDCELFDRGIATDHACERVSLSNRSLAENLFADGDGARSAVESVAAPVLAHFALSELHGSAVARAHAEGLLHLNGLDNPVAIERLALPWDLVPKGAARSAMLDLRRALDTLRPHVAGVIELEDAGSRALDGGAAPVLAADELLDAVVARDVHGRASGPAIAIAVAVHEDPRLERFVRRLAERISGERLGGSVRLRFALADGPVRDGGLLAAAAACLRADPFAAIDLRPDPEPRRASDLRISIARVTLNLPLMLLGARGGGLKEALDGLDRGLRLALDAIHERAWAQRKGARSGLPGIVGFLGGAAAVAVPASGQEADLEIWGLAHALELLVRRGVVSRPAVPEAAAKLLSHVHYHLGEERDGLRFHVRTGGCANKSVRRRLLSACEANAAKLEAADLAAELRNERSVEGALPLHLPFADPRNRPLIQSRAVERLGPGLGILEACFAGGLSGAALAEVRDGSRIRTLRLAPAGSGGIFEVQEELFR